MKQILIDNAYEAWKEAIAYHDKIEAGISSLQSQKGFVSALQNAVELFLKQVMLNQNDKAVVSLSKKSKIAFPTLEQNYNSSVDLNRFFVGLKPDVLNAFHSITFSELIKNHTQILNLSGKNYSTELELLQKLRNAETHFYINKNCFLDENSFSSLHNFMVDFYEVLISKNLFPKAMYIFETGDIRLEDEERSMEFLRSRYTNYSYLSSLKDNQTFKEILSILKDEHECEYAHYGYNLYEMTMHIIFHHPDYKHKFDDIFAILRLMEQYKIFEIEHYQDEVELENGQKHIIEEHSFKITL